MLMFTLALSISIVQYIVSNDLAYIVVLVKV